MAKVNVIDLLEAGLRAEQLRQRAIASNAANLETPGYKTVDVNFQETLAKALDGGKEGTLADLEGEIFKVGNLPVKQNGNDVSLEGEVGKMIENSLRLEAYVRIMSKKYKQMELATQVS